MVEDKDDYIDFKPVEDDIYKKIDEKLKDFDRSTREAQIRDRIRLLNDVRENPPEKGEMSVEIPEGIYAIDLRALLEAQLTDCPATVIPMLIDHGVRTAVDIKNAYKPEKRRLNFEYWWVIFMIIGLGAGLFFINMIFHIF